MSDYKVTVCDQCKCASCWHGEFYCEKSRSAGTVDLPVSELRGLGLENPSWWEPEYLEKVTGVNPNH